MILYRVHKTLYTCTEISRGKTVPQYSSSADEIVFWQTTVDIVPCTLDSLHLYKHKSEREKVSIKQYSSSTNILYLNMLTLYQ